MAGVPGMVAVLLLSVVTEARFVHRDCRAPPAQEDVYAGDGGACAQYRSCEAALCTCLGQPMVSSAAVCLNGTSNASIVTTGTALTCELVVGCMRSFLHDCAREAADNATADTSARCVEWRGRFAAAFIPTLATNSSYEGSSLQRSCQYRMCLATSWAGLGDSCVLWFGTNDSDVCSVYTPTGDDGAENVTIGPRRPVVPPAWNGAPSLLTALAAVLPVVALLFAA